MIRIILFGMLLFSEIFGKTYSFKTITVDAGLPQSTISVIIQDNRGFLWLGTYGGIVRYDGINMKPFTSNEGYPFFMNKGIIEKEPGVLWVADDSEGLWELRNDVATQIVFDENRPDAKINFIYKGEDGRILVGAEPGGLYIFNRGTITRIGAEQGLISEQIISGAIDKDGNIWVGTFEHGAQYIVNGVPDSVITAKDGLPGEYVRYILPRSNGEVWFGTKRGLYILEQDGHTTLLDDPGKERFIFHILEEDEHNLWVSTSNNGGGLVLIRDKKITENLDYDSGLRSYKATWSYIDEYGSMFIGTANGLAKITNRQFINYSSNDGLLEPYITGVCQTDDGTIWVSTQANGVYKYQAEKFLRVNIPGLEKFQRVKYLSAIGNQVWWATSRGLVITENGVPVSNKIVDSLMGETIRKITRTADGTIYIAAFRRLYRISRDTLVDITGNLTRGKYSFWALEEDKAGTLWLATNGQGVWRHIADTWVKVIPPYPSFPKKFFGISKDVDGNLFFSSSRGAHKWDGEKFSLIFPEKHTVWDILPTVNNGTWFGTSRGLFQERNGHMNLFNMMSGLITSEFNISSFLEARDGTLWFGGVGGLVKYRIVREYPLQISPKLYILSIENSKDFFSPDEELVFQPEQHDITFHFTGIYLGSPESVRYRYKLEGIDRQWSSEVERNFVSYSHLPDGEYTFLVEAKGALGIWSKAPASVSFRILKPWWKALPVQIIFSGLLVFLVWGIVKWRIQTVERRNRLLEEQVRERTAKLINTNLRLEEEIQMRKQAKEEVVKSRERYRSTIKSMKDLIFTLDKDGFFINYYTPEASKLYSPPEEFLGKHFKNALPEHVALLLEEGINKVHSGESHAEYIHSLDKDGKEYWFEATLTAIHDMAGTFTGVTGVVRDVTDRKHAEEKLVKALEEAKQGEKIKSLFLANMSHEIRTPLNSIMGFTELLKNSTSQFVSEEEKIFFDAIKSSGQRLLHTVHEILDISQIEAGMYQMNFETFDLCQLVKNIIAECDLIASYKNLELAYNCPEKSAFIRADSHGITLAIRNIIENAIKYTEKGKITVSLKQSQKQYILTINDTGIGISEDYLENLFDTFSQESEGFTKKFQGIGLGMAIAKRHLDLNEVGIRAKSSMGVGTTVILTFKPAEKHVPETPHEKKYKEDDGAPSSGDEELPQILLVEDDPDAQKLTEFYLRGEYNIYFAVSVEEAKQKLKKYKFAMVLLDLSLVGNKDGLDLVRWMRKSRVWKKMPVIATTAHAFTSDREKCLAAGCDDFLSKPIKGEKLLEKIRKHIKAPGLKQKQKES